MRREDLLPEENKPNAIITHVMKIARLTASQMYALGRCLDGLKHDEIADEMGVSRRAVSAKIESSIKKMRVLFPQYAKKLRNKNRNLTQTKSTI